MNTTAALTLCALVVRLGNFPRSWCRIWRISPAGFAEGLRSSISERRAGVRQAQRVGTVAGACSRVLHVVNIARYSPYYVENRTAVRAKKMSHLYASRQV